MDKGIIGNHPLQDHPYGVSLCALDGATNTGVAHRKLKESGQSDAFLDYTVQALQKHHISPENMERRRKIIQSLHVVQGDLPVSPYPKNLSTRKGNFAEVVLAEYLQATTDAQMPIYKLRYNPNADQSMKGDDVLLFDLDSDPIRIVVGEAKFRGTLSKQVVKDTVTALTCSRQKTLPASLAFVADRLFEEGKTEMSDKVFRCATLIAANRLRIDHVGFLMSSTKAGACIDENTTGELRNLLMISLGMQSPEAVVQEAFSRLEEAL